MSLSHQNPPTNTMLGSRVPPSKSSWERKLPLLHHQLTIFRELSFLPSQSTSKRKLTSLRRLSRRPMVKTVPLHRPRQARIQLRLHRIHMPHLTLPKSTSRMSTLPSLACSSSGSIKVASPPTPILTSAPAAPNIHSTSSSRRALSHPQ